MNTESVRRKHFLFVDDDGGFLADLCQLFTEMSGGAWEIFTAENHSQALALLRGQTVDVVVLDLDMPVMDGLQFLKLLSRTYPGQSVVILTGQASEEKRKLCLESGAALFLEKLITPEGFASVYGSLDLLAAAAPQEGFRGMMRRVGLQEVLQMECLGRKSSVLQVFTGKVRGKIFVADGAIIHAESGSLQGEMALYGLLGLRGGEFNLLPFSEPAVRTISGQYEFLLMEAARLSDEGSSPLRGAVAEPAALAACPEFDLVPSIGVEQRPTAESVRIEELLLATCSGTVLHEWQCQDVEQRLKLIQQLEADGALLNRSMPAGRLERVVILTPDARIICQTQPETRLFVRSATIVNSAI